MEIEKICRATIAVQIVEPEVTTQVVKETVVVPKPAEPEFTTQAEPEVIVESVQERTPLPEFSQEEKNNNNPMFWFLVAVTLTVVGVIITFVLPRWLGRRKGFGF